VVDWSVIDGDCRERLLFFDPNSVDAIVTDPPYELGLMGRAWDKSGVAFDATMWRSALNALKPGGHLLAFSGTRTYHRMACAIEDAGFEIRDEIAWVYGTGYPKSHDVSKAFDKGREEERGYLDKPTGGLHIGTGATVSFGTGEPGRQLADNPVSENAKKWRGWGSALKPAHEPICVARKPLEGTIVENVAMWGTGALNIDATRVGYGNDSPTGRPGAGPARATYEAAKHGLPVTGPEPWTPGGGRWPPNLVADSEAARVIDEQSGETNLTAHRVVSLSENGPRAAWRLPGGARPDNTYTDSGGASRFFPVFDIEESAIAYIPKPTTEEREAGVTNDGLGQAEVATGPSNWNAAPKLANDHPSLKPIALLRWLCRLVTPPEGTVLDMFNGVGSTGCAARLEGFNYIGIELDPRYARIARERIAYWEARPPAAVDVPQIPPALKVSPRKTTSLEDRW
jgi:DNA modification methylase